MSPWSPDTTIHALKIFEDDPMFKAGMVISHKKSLHSKLYHSKVYQGQSYTKEHGLPCCWKEELAAESTKTGKLVSYNYVLKTAVHQKITCKRQ